MDTDEIRSTQLRPYLLVEAANAYPMTTSEGGEETHNTTLVEAIAALKADATAAGKIYRCGKCAGEGRHLLSLDTGNTADTSMIPCNNCNGWGYTEALRPPTKVIYSDYTLPID